MGRKKVLTDPTSIRCNKATKQRYFNQGKYGETMDEILNRIINHYELFAEAFAAFIEQTKLPRETP